VRKILHAGLCVFLLVSLSYGRGQARGDVGDDWSIPFRTVGGYMIVFEGRIGNFTGLHFLLDTGTSHSAVSVKLARAMGIPLQARRVFDFNRDRTMDCGILPEIQFGRAKFSNVSMLVADLSRVSDFGDGLDAIIGADVLSRSNFYIDYAARRLVFTSASADAPAGSGGPKILLIEVHVQGHPVELLVDTGVEGVILFEDRVRRCAPDLRTADRLRGVTIGPEVQATEATIPDVQVAARTENLRAYFVKSPPDDVLEGVDGFLGTNALNASRIEFDFANGRFRWER
jgi:predicted aspartyl protease